MSLTTIEKRYGITLRKNKSGKLKKYKKTGKRYKKVCDNKGCVMSANDGNYCCNFILYEKCKMNNTGEITFYEKKAKVFFHKSTRFGFRKYIKKSGAKIKVCFMINCLTNVKENEIYCCNFLDKGKCKKINPFSDTQLTKKEQKAGIFLKKNKKEFLLKYNNNQKRVCMNPDCLKGIMPKEDYCIRFINSGRCDDDIIDDNIKLTDREKEAGVTLRKNRKGEMKKYKKSDPNWIKVCEKTDCIMLVKQGNNEIYCAKFITDGFCDGVDVKCDIELTDIELNAGIILRKSSQNEMKKYKLVGNKYKKICEQKNCVIAAKPGNIYCYNFVNQGACSKDEVGEDKVLTEKEKDAGIILKRNRKRELQKYKRCLNETLIKVCMKENCLAQVKEGEKYCKRFLRYKWCENVVENTEATLTEREEKAGVKLRPNINGKFKKYWFLNERWVKLCEKSNCFNYSQYDTPFCVADGGLPLCECCEAYHTANDNHICGYCNPSNPTRKKEFRIKKLLEDNNFTFRYNRYIKINNGENKAAPDFLLENTRGYHLILEVDEYQHRRKCYEPQEERRREQLIQEALGIPCIFIRFNPDAFKLDGKTHRVYREERQLILLSRIHHWLKTKPTKQLHIEFLFYNNTENCSINNCDNSCNCVR